MTQENMSGTGSTLLLLLRNPKDQLAWTNFVLRYGPKIHTWCRRWGLQEPDAQDVTQEVLFKFHDKVGKFA